MNEQKMRIGAVLFLMILVHPGAAEALGPSGAVISDTEIVNANAADDGSFDDDDTASIATDGHGTWLAVWQWRTSTGGPRDVRLARSTDNGLSWTDPVQLSPFADVNAFPHVAAGGQGVWLAAWVEHIDGDKEIAFTRSMDDGLTWRSPLPLSHEAGNDDEDDTGIRLVADRQGNWCAVWFRHGDPVVARSSDNGLTWSGARPLGEGGYSYVGVDLATDRFGHWVAVWSSLDVDGGDQDLFFARSVDGGLTWSEPALLNTDASQDDFDDLVWRSSSVVTDGKGNWIAVWARYAGIDGDLFVARSTDNAATWSEPSALGFGEWTWAASLSAATDGRGTWVVVEIESGLGQIAPVIVRSSDNGATWSEPEPLSLAGGFDVEVATDGSGNWLAVWDSRSPFLDGTYLGGEGDILSVRFAFCKIEVQGKGTTSISFFPDSPAPAFELVSGTLSALWADGHLHAATCLGDYSDNPATDGRPMPPEGDGYYYLARALDGICGDAGYGDSSVEPDLRDELDACP